MPIAKTVFEKLDMKRIKSLVIARMEEVVAEKVVNKFVTEMGTDMKDYLKTPPFGKPPDGWKPERE
jgi:hypothetical protein